jgi:hypothetical protein
MSSLAIASIVFGCSFGAALIGMVLHVNCQTIRARRNSTRVRSH